MERFDYIILTNENRWESTGKQATKDELQQDIKDVTQRLVDEGRDAETLIIFSAPKMDSPEVNS